ncbi:TspO/MBR family protein [Propioniferax innocua]|uniref:TspO/MBR related protein n=1 Tax=Propioniferax innocua TaxID=1753 RepID=A0A542Z8A9_9ACTN|nr:TspO/MBR family protein [Propioniferax innocua]TQL56578.1 TspO/MBR related protein [Propioniferax innocua]
MASFKHLALTGIATAACAVAGSAATSRSVGSRWYESLDKPAWQPPGWAFPVAWTTLYLDIAWTTAEAMDHMTPQERAALMRALVINLGLNAGWCWVFFDRRLLNLGVLVAASLAVSSADLARRAGGVRRGLGRRLAPYALWCAFATALTWSIARRNG